MQETVKTSGVAWRLLLAGAMLCAMAATAGRAMGADGARLVQRYNVVWESASKDASGVMPLGNGDIAAGVYAIEDGDLYLLLAKNDAFNSSGEIYKTGRVRIGMTPNPFKSGKPFRQTLDLATGSILIDADGVKIRLWADANRPVYHAQVDSAQEIDVTAQPEFWNRLDKTKDVRVDRPAGVAWYFAVGDKSVYADDLEYYHVKEMAGKFADPYRFNTFGNLLQCAQMSLKEGALAGKGRSFDIRIHACAMQTPDPAKWIDAIERQTAGAGDAAADWREHCRWWADFWNRSWIVASDRTLPADAREVLHGEPRSGTRDEDDGAAIVAQSFNVFRFLMAAQSRGRIQTKFNGGLFTQQERVPDGHKRHAAAQLPDGTWLTHEDDRLWGRRFTYQNQRLLYWPMLASGDFDLMKPFFNYYFNLLEMRKAITKAWFGHDGAYYRENIEPTGAERDCGKDGRPPKTKPGESYPGWYHDYYFTSGLETLAMMCDYANFTDDAGFRDRVIVPFAREVLLFYDRHYPREQDGKLRLEPAQVLETWWVAVNPATDVAGLRFCIDELLAMNAGTSDDQTAWRKLRSQVPEVSLHEIDGRPAIAPALKWERQHNAENGELYPVFPFRCFGVALGSGALVEWTMKHRSVKDAFGDACWTQDQIHWACAGKATEAADGLVRRFRIASKTLRFPMYGRAGPDSCPDFDHFGSGSVALERMLVQEAGSKILLLPAWPADWDVDFKLHLSHNTVIAGVVKDGKLQTWEIEPAARRKDVTVCEPQREDGSATAIPANAHPLLAGADQTGHNRFPGEIGRITMFRGRLDEAAIRELSASDRSKSVSLPQVIGCWMNPKPGDALTMNAEDLAGAVSFEMWIKPTADGSGRILDKVTVGKDDGLLLDVFPKQSLRLIVGRRKRLFADVLKPDAWHHVAVVIQRGRDAVYLDGKRL